MTILQPCDWHEADESFKYVVDAYGRTETGDIARVRITGFQPYFYIRAGNETASIVQRDLLKAVGNSRMRFSVEAVMKLDAMRGFARMDPIKVWKVSCTSLRDFKSLKSLFMYGKTASIGGRALETEDIFEANLPPMIRMFHERNILPASAFEFEGDSVDVGEVNVDVCYTAEYTDITPNTTAKIPLYVAAYDLECYSSIRGKFPSASVPADEIIQIGLSLRWSDDLLKSEERIVFVSGTCDASADPGVVFIPCRNERDMLLRFQERIRLENPDIITGYNTFAFDDSYVAERARVLNISLDFGRYDYNAWKVAYGKKEHVETEKKSFELASGKFAVHYISMPGRLAIDLHLVMRREQTLDSFKLDSVANTFLRDKVSSFTLITGEKTQLYEIHTKSTRGLFPGNLVRFDIITNTINPYRGGQKFFVKEVFPKKFIVELPQHTYLFDGDLDAESMRKIEWSFAKDDVEPDDIFRLHRGTAADRAVIAKYCIQDCDLVLTLMAKMDTLANAFGMADVCRVPVQFIFLRGQGIKIYSAVVYYASQRDQIIMTQQGTDDDSSYEGAIVLPPKIGMYLDQPIPVLDFNSLYPSNMIALNLSPDTLAYVKTYDTSGTLVKQVPADIPNLAGFKVDEVKYDTYNENDEPTGRIKCGFVQPTEDPRTVGILPLALDILLKKRKETRKLMETEADDAQRAVLNGRQLAYKVVANSIYGQCGSSTSPIKKVEVAASTTAVGRQKIFEAKKIVEEQFGAEVIYGDTDSIFIKFPTKDLQESMDLARKAADVITKAGRKAHKIEYEKTFFPFILFCRKRYMGLMYENDTTHCKRKSMGIAIKRRDNAPVVKDILGGALDIVMEKRDVRQAQAFVKQSLVSLMMNSVPLEKFVITKQLRDDYKLPDQIAHAVLAKRMAARDPGSAPHLGDRIPYVYVKKNADKSKQGDKIEHVDYARKHGLAPDVEFYISNQIQNPLAQMFAMALEDLDGYVARRNYQKMFEEYRETLDEEKATLKVLKEKEKELETMMFLGSPHLRALKRGPMDSWVRRP
jgi:DNA polymerase elongation subunit (family B)